MTKSAILKQNQGFLSTLPIGVIIAWHRDLDLSKVYIPVLPPGWVECNGQELLDPESPFHRQVIPALNIEGRFLRGSNTSGTAQADAFQGHHHKTWSYSGTPGSPYSVPQTGTNPQEATDLYAQAPSTDGANGAPRIAKETRPINMSVVWIMKVKQIVAAKATSAVQAEANAPLGAIYINQTGKVGIGTSTPRTALEVNGTVQVNGGIKSPMWKVTQVFNVEPGSLPLSAAWMTGGGTLLIFASGSGYVKSGGHMGMSIRIDGKSEPVGYSKITTNEMSSHKAFTTNALVVGGIAPGSHTITLDTWNNTITDGSDFFSVTVLELPF